MRIYSFAVLASLFLSSPALSSPEIGTGQLVKGPQAAVEFCNREPRACKPVPGSAPMLSLDRLQLLNLTVNASVQDVLDQPTYGKKDHWAIAKTRGDCEDIALRKRAILIEKGIDSRTLRIAIVRKKPGPLGAFLTRTSSRSRGGSDYHAVLVVTRPDGDYILDNLDNRVRHWSKTDYIFEIVQDRTQFASWRRVTPARTAAGIEVAAIGR